MINKLKIKKHAILSERGKKFAPMVLVCFALILITIAAYVYIAKNELRQIESEFKLEVSDIIAAIEKEKSSNFTFIRSIESFYEGSEFVTREEFRQFSKHGLLRHRNVKAVEWVPRVAHSERQQYVGAAIASGFPNFNIKERDAQGDLLTAKKRKEYFPIYYIEPYEGNEKSLGFDVGSDPKRFEALNKARYTGMMTATSGIRLVQDETDRHGFLIFIPVYKKGDTANTVQGRYDNITGFIRGTFFVDTMTKDALSHLRGRGLEGDIRVCIYDITDPSKKERLYTCSHLKSKEHSHKGAFKTSDMIDVADRIWLVECMASPRFIAKRKTQLPFIILIGGLIFSALLITYLVTSQKRAAYIERLANELSVEVAYHKEAEKTLKISEYNYREIFNSANDAFIVHDAQTGAILDVNKKCIEMFGCSKEELMRMSTIATGDVMSPYPQKEAFDYIKKAGDGQPRVFESQARDCSGNFFRAEISLKEIILNDQRRMVAVIRDVTERKKAEEILKRDKNTFERLVQKRTKELISTQEALAKSKHLSDIGTLAATVAHELRNPLAAIQIAAYNIRRKTQDTFIDRHVLNIEKKISESNQIINNLLGYSRIKMPQKEDANIHEILNECISLMEKRFVGQQVSLIKKYKEREKDIISADIFQLKEIFSNILVNAYQSTKGKDAKIEVEISNRGKNFIYISFRDNGTGIDTKDLDKVFNAFFTKRSKGTGLGLTICRELINLHGGEIKIKSRKNIGTVVSIKLPIT